MSIVGIIVVFVVLWWLVFFILLPIGTNPDNAPEKGHASSAPANPNIKKKMLITTIVTFLLTTGYFSAIEFGYINDFSLSS